MILVSEIKILSLCFEKEMKRPDKVTPGLRHHQGVSQTEPPLLWGRMLKGHSAKMLETDVRNCTDFLLLKDDFRRYQGAIARRRIRLGR